MKNTGILKSKKLVRYIFKAQDRVECITHTIGSINNYDQSIKFIKLSQSLIHGIVLALLMITSGELQVSGSEYI